MLFQLLALKETVIADSMVAIIADSWYTQLYIDGKGIACRFSIGCSGKKNKS